MATVPEDFTTKEQRFVVPFGGQNCYYYYLFKLQMGFYPVAVVLQ
jgi:hypothetical protein